MSIEAILCDIDHTIYDYSDAHHAALDTAVLHLKNRCSHNTDELKKTYLHARAHIHRQIAGTASSHNRILYFQHMCELLKLPPCPLAYELDELYWAKFLDTMRLREGVLDFLKRNSQLPLIWVSDFTAKIQYKKLNVLGLCDYTTGLVSSEEVGHDKPHPYVFLAALHKLEMKPDQVCMIGDEGEKDIAGALALGIKAFHLRTKEGPSITGCTEFKSFTELGRLAEIERTKTPPGRQS